MGLRGAKMGGGPRVARREGSGWTIRIICQGGGTVADRGENCATVFHVPKGREA